MLDPIIKTIEVPCSQEKAFTVFIKELDSWWPVEKFSTSAMRGETVKSIRVDARAGGTIVEIGPGGKEQLWGTIKSYDPHDFISMDFHLPHPSEEKISFSLVEVRFTSLEEEKTRVVLTQSNWEAFGDMAEMMRGGYGGGWAVIFEKAYKSACGG